MRLDAVSVTSTNIPRTVEFYSLLGFTFPEYTGQQHVEAEGDIRFMIDDAAMMKDILGHEPAPGNHSSFAIKCESPAEVDATAEALKAKGFVVLKEPWDAFWGQRYAIVKDPDGYMVDLFASLA
jgi:uncharacterized glyoxalase superfamily protein PhnB